MLPGRSALQQMGSLLSFFFNRVFHFFILLQPDVPFFHFFFQPDVPFLSDPGVPGVRSMGPVSHKLRHLVTNSTDVTLADGDTKPILTDNANRTIQGSVAMHVTHPINLVGKF